MRTDKQQFLRQVVSTRPPDQTRATALALAKIRWSMGNRAA